MVKDLKSKDIEALYKTQKGNIYKVNEKKYKKNFNIPFSKKPLNKSLMKTKISTRQQNALGVGGEIYTPTDSSIETKIDPI
ncbi:MAG: hypothetical protein PQJ45_01790 [Sphaerochaetaceae bacterium]|nr:hypothetical protein [Sphaerochaetaceae bacterium]MDC7243551.1 hypothetical protein [Sphaerochaetaceae bacterium]